MTTLISRVNITLPSVLFTELKKDVAKRERSKFIAKALEERLARIKRERALKSLSGIWDKAGGIKFASNKELSSWRSNLWSSFDKKLTKK